MFFCRFLQKSRSKSRNQLDETFPAVITLRYKHNHSHHIAATVKQRNMTNSTRQKIVAHGPGDAADHDSRSSDIDGSVTVAQPESSSGLATEEFSADEWCYQAVDYFCRRVKQGLEENPTVFKPAVAKMSRNLCTYVASESGLLTTLHTMGKYTGLPLKGS